LNLTISIICCQDPVSKSKKSETRRPRTSEKLKYFTSSLQVPLVPLMLVLKLLLQHCRSKML
jgi:hypothetical protein